MTYRAPLLVTRCDRCYRRRACFPVWPGWLCRQCVGRLIAGGKVALAAFAAQAREVGR